MIRGFHQFHTGPQKGWPDVAYNFFVDRFGVVWEGREGSLTGPVQPSATGGNQGFSQICCFIGDHGTQPPTPEAQRSMIAVLAALAERHGLDLAPGATTSFVSRGSNKWPAGSPVTTTTVAGHRDMSQTTCPGDAAYPLVRDVFAVEAAALLASRRAPAPAPAPPAAPEPPPEAAAGATGTPGAPSEAAQGGGSGGQGLDPAMIALVTGGVVATGVAAGLAKRPKKAGAPGDRTGPTKP
ncbi:peptidoglycan recognition protein family protein [Blastococcus atacamensis]|uniref:peptidoglycan recognition protein family protein n=1 Tax=Blastococcus atacamensis TaxID=2070508 RepID=UPI0018E4207A|nr:peptidoglycan recognition family protein [Blastococcus atacamensis]